MRASYSVIVVSIQVRQQVLDIMMESSLRPMMQQSLNIRCQRLRFEIVHAGSLDFLSDSKTFSFRQLA